jgi:hypothetical protein
VIRPEILVFPPKFTENLYARMGDGGDFQREHNKSENACHDCAYQVQGVAAIEHSCHYAEDSEHQQQEDGPFQGLQDVHHGSAAKQAEPGKTPMADAELALDGAICQACLGG